MYKHLFTHKCVFDFILESSESKLPMQSVRQPIRELQLV